LSDKLKILKNIKAKVRKEKLMEELCLNSDNKSEFLDLLNDALQIASPKAAFTEAIIDNRGNDYVIVEGIKFNSRILKVNLTDIYKVFPYLITAGIEIEKWSEKFEEVLRKYWVDSIKEEILENAIIDVLKELDEVYDLNNASDMNPGSLKAWPIFEQKKLFKLLGDSTEKVGVNLSETMLMYPTKSVTGLRFPTEINFENCQLCDRENCPGRRTSYQPNLFQERYTQSKQ
jgi:hypothetical protein